MEITDILAQMGGLQSMARELGVSETQAASGADGIHGRALPSLGEKRSAWQPGQRQRSVDGCSERDLVTRCTHPSSSLQQHHPPRRDAVRRREPAEVHP